MVHQLPSNFLSLYSTKQGFDFDITMVAVVNREVCVCVYVRMCVLTTECGPGSTAELLTQHTHTHTHTIVVDTFIIMKTHRQTKTWIFNNDFTTEELYMYVGVYLYVEL